jgi:hypothetical protein
MAFPVSAHHVRKKKIHVEARAVLDERNAVSVKDVTPNRRNANGDARTGGNLGRVFGTSGDLHVPKPADKSRYGKQDDCPKKVDAVGNLSAFH